MKISLQNNFIDIIESMENNDEKVSNIENKDEYLKNYKNSGVLLDAVDNIESPSKEILVNLPVNGMYSQQLIRYAAPFSSWIIFIVIALVVPVVLYNLTKKRFLKEI